MTTETRVDLLRHGEAEGGRRLRGSGTDDPLSPRGWVDMIAVLDREGPWDRIVSSPMRRCADFARVAGERLGVPMVLEPRFTEYDFGAWGGRALEELWAREGEALARFFADPDAVTPPGGEAAVDFRARVRAAWGELLASGAGGAVLLVGHGGVLRQLVADALGVPFSLHAALEWPNAALSRVRVFDDAVAGRTTTLAFHARRHLSGGAGEGAGGA